LILGVSVSIDALVVGITALFSRGDYIFSDGLLIGGITLVLVTIAFILSRHLQKMTFIAKYSDYLGGIILILFALKMMFL
jgi:putative Mn2+ efflux pump MntP